MEFFEKARVIRLRSHHEKYLTAEDDQESVCQDRDGTARNARWTVEIVKDGTALRLKSIYGKYLSASNMPFRLGFRGKKVLQTLPKRLNSSLEWEPVRQGYQVKLRTPYGQFLRANGGVPPWRNSITHDIPHRSARQDWVLWDIDVVEIKRESSPEHRSTDAAQSTPTPTKAQFPPKSPPAKPPPQPLPSPPQSPHKAVEPPPRPPPELPVEIPESSSPPKIVLKSPGLLLQEESRKSVDSPRSNGRMIFYHVSEDKDDTDDVGREDVSFAFRGSKVAELKKKLKEETGLEEFEVCSRNPLNGQLYPLRLHLPPNNHDMHLVVVPQC